MTVKELRAKKQAALDAARAIKDGAKAENREWTDEETSDIESLMAESDECDGLIAEAQERANKQAALAAKLEAQNKVGGRRSPAGSGSAPRVEVDGPAWEKDPNRGFANHRDFLLTVMKAERRGQVDERLVPLQATAGSDEQGEYNDAYGGYFVPAGLAPNILQVQAEADPMSGRTTMLPMTAPKISLNARVDKNHSTSVSGGLTVGRSAETVAKNASREKFEQISMDTYSMFGLAYATEELLADSPISFAALLEAGFRDEFSSAIINERLNGTGVGQYLGINKSPCLISVDKETGQPADTIVYENIVNMRARCWKYEQAVWLYNHDCLPQLMRLVLPIGTGGVPMWQNSAREGEPDMLLGRPAFPTEYCETVGDAGDLVLGNWSQYLEGLYQPMQQAESIHVRFLNHERAFKFWVRNAGSPWWSSALTPKKSASTLSPFVRLAARA